MMEFDQLVAKVFGDLQNDVLLHGCNGSQMPCENCQRQFIRKVLETADNHGGFY